jgi:transcriptional regulator
MYIPDHFRERDLEALHRLMRSRALATLVTCFAGDLSANHIPLYLTIAANGQSLLRGHIARANPLAQAAREPLAALAIFHGPQSYVSPSWYPAKAEHGKVVPTWNYVAVHAQGNLRLVDDADWLRHQLEDLTAQQEAGFRAPWSLADAPEIFIERLSAAIVGVELTVDKLEGKWKVSQNQTAQTREQIARGLTERGDSGDAEMAALVSPLFANKVC